MKNIVRLCLKQFIKPLRKLTFHDLERMHTILSQRILYSYGKAQSYLNGKNPSTENLWIVKPAAKSRGRGIMTFSNIHKLLKYIDAGNGLSTQWIVQKYMENPLIIAKRKFDLRQWILVTSWNPLTIYFYHECYARFSVEEYTTNLQELENSFIHLVNNSIGKNSENFNKIILAENNQPMEGYMWDFRTFSEYITWKNQGMNLVERKIQPRMKEIAIYALMCASEMIEHRKNSWELYGFDFMVDDQYNTWLIEINSSPACDYSTKVTERYVQKALVELLSVVLDVREWEAQPKKQRGEKPSTGGWECIYQGPVLELPIGSFGTDFSLKGESVKGMNRRNQASIPVVSATMAASIGGGNNGDLSVVSIGMNNKHHQDSFTGGGNESNSYRSTSGRKANTKPPIKSSSNNNTSNSNSANVKASMPKPVQGSTNARTKPANVARRHHDEALILDDEDDDSSVATNDKFHRRERNSSAALSHRSNSGQPDLASETYDDSSDDHEKKPSKHTTTTTTSTTMTMSSKSNASPSAAPSNNPHIGVKKEGSIVNKAAVAIPIKTFNVDF